VVRSLDGPNSFASQNAHPLPGTLQLLPLVEPATLPSHSANSVLAGVREARLASSHGALLNIPKGSAAE
jgi:hypothetical protein